MNRPTLILAFAAVAAPAGGQDVPGGAPFAEAARRIDEIVGARLEQLGIEAAGRCSDAVFLRRVHLDLTGTLPEPAAVRVFLDEERPGKRARKIEALLASPEFADYWAMRWSDLLRVKAEFPIRLWPNGAQAYHHWVRDAIARELPFDAFARELLTASGSCYRVPQVNFWRAAGGHEPDALAAAVSLAFLGTRFDAWPESARAGLTALCSRVGFKGTREWKEEIVFFDVERPAVAAAHLPDGTRVGLEPDTDPRRVLADWLIRPENPWFARVAVNRVWAWLLGRGIVHEPDDFRADNPPVLPELLAFLAGEFASHGWDRKHLLRIILNSRTYQRSAVAPGDPEQASAYFACYTLRPLEAEVLIDALNRITGTVERYSSAVPEPFTFVPPDVTAVQLPDGSLTSPFLEMFGRPPRDTGLASERGRHPTPEQRLHLLNSTHILGKLSRGPRLRAVLRRSRNPREAAVQLYLLFLSRRPTAAELRAVSEYAASGVTDGPGAALDLAWALLNSSEFLYRH